MIPIFSYQRQVLRWVLVALALAPFSQVIGHQYLSFEDDAYVFMNPHLKEGIGVESIGWAFSADLTERSGYIDYWQPVTVLSRALDVQFFGLKPGGHHLTNLLLHIINTLLLFYLLDRQTGKTLPSFLTAALFAVHPLRVEAVAWISARKDILSSSFGLLTLIFYCRYVEHPVRRRYVLSLLAFLLGLMSKSMLAVLPLGLLLFDLWPLKRGLSLRILILEKVPFFALGAISGLVTFFAGQPLAFEGVPAAALFLNSSVAYIRYIFLTLYPVDLACVYPPPMNFLPTWQMAGAAAALFVLSALAHKQLDRRPYLLVGWFWFLAMLLPVISLASGGVADRYAYFSQIGLFMMFSWAVADLSESRSRGRFPAVVNVFVVLLLLILTVLSFRQTRLWKDTFTLFEHTVRVTKDNSLAHTVLGFAEYKRGNVVKAGWHFSETVRIRPDDWRARNNLGFALADVGNLEAAVVQYEDSIRRNPNYVSAHNNLGIALARLGKTEEAIREFEAALRIDPHQGEVHNNFGKALLLKGNVDEAIHHFQKAIRILPENPEVQEGLAGALRLREKNE